MNIFIDPTFLEYHIIKDEDFPTTRQVFDELVYSKNHNIYLWASEENFIEICSTFIENYFLEGTIIAILKKDIDKYKNYVDIAIDNDPEVKEYCNYFTPSSLEHVLQYFVPDSIYLNKIERIINSSWFAYSVYELLDYTEHHQIKIKLKDKYDFIDYLQLEGIFRGLLEQVVNTENCRVVDLTGFGVEKIGNKFLFFFTPEGDPKERKWICPRQIVVSNVIEN